MSENRHEAAAAAETVTVEELSEDREHAVVGRGMRFSYNHDSVLIDVSFEVHTGSFVSMVGPNGGGKTTLLKIIAGLLKPSTGTVRIFGRPPSGAHSKVGYVPQYTLFDPYFPATVSDVVLMGRLRNGPGFYSRSDREAAERSLEEVDLARQRNTLFADLSGGQRQRVLIARALVGSPEILLLDEPTSSVDVVVESRLNQLLQKLNERMTIVLATHDMGFVSNLVESVICVNRRVHMHPVEEIKEGTIEDTYGGIMRIIRHDIEQHHPEPARGSAAERGYPCG